MSSRFLTLGATLASLCMAAPLAAQSASDDARFAAAQARFDAELARYRAEFDRYRSAHADGGLAGPGGYRQAPLPGSYPPPRVGDPDDEGDEDRAPDDRDENGYDPARDYRAGATYRERTLSPDERVYAGEDGRYYCKRSDGTTGLIVGGAAGGILGNVIDGGRSRTVGTLLGGAAGALAGRSIERNQAEVRCR